jgi:hypothetical protein
MEMKNPVHPGLLVNECLSDLAPTRKRAGEIAVARLVPRVA